MNKVLDVGMSAESLTVVDDESIRKFSEVSGDVNPIHLDEGYAVKTIFKQRIAPGMQIASYISAVLANQLPGAGTVYLEQSIRFLKPVYINDTIKTIVTITEALKSNKYKLITEQFNQDGIKVIEGEALIKYLGDLI